MKMQELLNLQMEALELLDWDEEELKFAVESAISLFEEASKTMSPLQSRIEVFKKLNESYSEIAAAAIINLVMARSIVGTTAEA